MILASVSWSSHLVEPSSSRAIDLSARRESSRAKQARWASLLNSSAETVPPSAKGEGSTTIRVSMGSRCSSPRSHCVGEFRYDSHQIWLCLCGNVRGLAHDFGHPVEPRASSQDNNRHPVACIQTLISRWRRRLQQSRLRQEWAAGRSSPSASR